MTISKASIFSLLTLLAATLLMCLSIQDEERFSEARERTMSLMVSPDQNS